MRLTSSEPASWLSGDGGVKEVSKMQEVPRSRTISAEGKYFNTYFNMFSLQDKEKRQ
jgi:hypothetical protein